MARRPRQSARSRLEAQLAQYEPVLQAAFRAAVDDIRNHAEIGRIADMVERGDLDGAIRAVHLDPAAFRAFERVILDAYDAGGTAAINTLPALRDPLGGQLVIRFDVRSPRAEAWLRNHSSTLVTRIIEDQREAIRAALVGGMDRGENPRTTALDITGRINRATGRREGGIVGLSAPQEAYVANARQELLSGDEAALRAYLDRKRRDKRFDRTVLAAIRDGKPIPADMVRRMTARYSDNLLALRGEMIARTEALAALHASHREAMDQAMDTGAVHRENVTKTWLAALDSRTRDSHAATHGETVGIDERFSNGLLYPHEPGAPAEEVVACRCSLRYTIDHLAGLT